MRTVRWDGGQLRVNGRAIEIRGVNRHEHDERLGKYTCRPLMVKDICLMKQFNFNAVRCSHYPNRSLWYNLCDAYGLWVCDEANNETHGLVAYKNEEYLAEHRTWARAYVERMSRMVLRDRNHACVVTWSLGNESSYGANIEAMAAWARQHDPTRPLQYESCGGAACTDIICPMYPSAAKLRALHTPAEQNKKSIELGRRWPAGTHTAARPVIPCEYAHAMNNSLGNLDEFWALIRDPKFPSLQGGYIWDWVDQGLVKEVEGRELWVFGGYYGEDIHDAQWNINGLLWPDRTPHPCVFQAKRSMQPVSIDIAWASPDVGDTSQGWSLDAPLHATATIRNLHRFRSLRGMGWRWRAESDGEWVAGSREGEAEGLAAGPGEGVTVQVEFQLQLSSVSGGREVVLTVEVVLTSGEVWADVGHEVAFGQSVAPLTRHEDHHSAPPASPVASPGESPRTELLSVQIVGADAEGGAPLQLEEAGDKIVVKGGEGLRVTFCRRKGGLVGWEWGGSELLGMEERGEVLLQSFWRAHTDNDNGGPDTLARYGATEQVYSAASGFDRATQRVRGAMKFGLWWMGLWGDTSYGKQWEDAGLDRLQPTKVQVTVSRSSEQAVVVRASYTLTAEGTSTAIPCVTTYQVVASGPIVTTHEATIAPSLPPVARVGVQLSVPGKLHTLRWYGRGPHESYSDRQSGCKLGRFESEVDDTYVPYLCPQENGNKSDVRWAALIGEEGRGLLVQAGQHDKVHVSAHRFTPHDLHRCRHADQVRQREDVTVTVDHRHMPCGGDNSWSRAHMPKYLVPPGSYKYSFTLHPLSSPAAAHRPARCLAPTAQYREPPHWQARMAHARRRLRLGTAAAPVRVAEVIVELGSTKVTIKCLLLSLLLILAAVGIALGIVFGTRD